LEQADELVGLAGDPIQIVVGQFGPPRFDLTPHLLPFAFEDIVIHKRSSGSFASAT
jgi:hypothetical protein